MRRAFLTLYDYDTGGVWAYIRAYSPDEIRTKFRDVTVYDEAPVWMTEQERRSIEERGGYDVETVERDHPTFELLLRAP
jgi:hypothetical protein